MTPNMKAFYKTRNTEHRRNTGTLTKYQNADGTPEHWRNNGTLAEQSEYTTELWNMRKTAEKRNSKTTPRNTTYTERRHIEQIT